MRLNSAGESETSACLRLGIALACALASISTVTRVAAQDASTPSATTSTPRFGARARGRRDAERTARESAESATVHDNSAAAREGTDLGTALLRIEGVSLTRTGGLGSFAQLTLNGLTGDQVRVFVDGVPLEVAGYAFGVTSVPTTLVERVEVYRGVVPIRFGADALGGALNLVSPELHRRSGAAIAVQVGSFGTGRTALSVHQRDARSGLYSALSASFDRADNDYDVQVEVPDERGRPIETTVTRFHDAYAARGGSIEVGVADRPWAGRLSLRGYYSEYDKQLQNNTLMTVPYGAVTYSESVLGTMLRYVQPDLTEHVSLDAVVAYAQRTMALRDVSTDVYDWHGDVIFERPQPGEIDGTPRDTRAVRESVFARVGLAWRVSRAHTLRLVSTLAYDASSGITRSGLLPGSPDPLAATRILIRSTSGLEHRAELLDGRLENIAFAKHYFVLADADALPSGAALLPAHLESMTVGVGDGLRWRFARGLNGKLSYEYATRQPSAAEVFGDGILVVPNGTLVPERSHNANVGLTLDKRSSLGEFSATINGFLRVSDQLIQLLATASSYSYQNLLSARTFGADASARWRSRRQLVAVEAHGTLQDVRNDATAGPYAAFQGDRLPNVPWFFWGASVRLRWPSPLGATDELTLTWYGRYAHQFSRSWESLGAAEFRPTVPTQFSQSLSAAYFLRAPTNISVSVDLQNFTDEQLFDVYGQQLPGRALHGRLALSF